MHIGFIGLGNVGGKLAGSLLRNGFALTVRDLDKETARPFLDSGALWADSPRELAQSVDMVITCLPSLAACSAVMGGVDGVISGLSEGKIWAEMSTTDEAEVTRIGELVAGLGALPASKLKVLTNYLATANLVSLCEALTTAKKAGIDLNTAYDAIRISSGNSFVHETESQVMRCRHRGSLRGLCSLIWDFLPVFHPCGYGRISAAISAHQTML